MNVLSDHPSLAEAQPFSSRPIEYSKSGRDVADHRRDQVVTHRLLITALGGLFAVSAAICTTMIELGTLWRYSWLAICIGSAVVMVIE